MASVPYKPISWSDNEPTFTEKLNTMAQNEQWLFENSPRMMYTNGGLRRAEGIKILTGVIRCNPSRTGIQQHIQYFGSFFSQSCSPNVQLTLVHAGEVRITFGVKGIGQQTIDHRGFEVLGGAIHHGTWKAMTKVFWLNWIAVGY